MALAFGELNPQKFKTIPEHPNNFIILTGSPTFHDL